MATMNISLPEPMKAWVEDQAKSGQYSNSSDYVRDLIRRDRVRREAILRMQALVTEGMESGIGENTMDELEALALRHRGRS